MEYVTLGNTGLVVSRLCFGTLTLGPLQNNLAPSEGGELLQKAFAAGVNFLDTAQLYKTYPHIRDGLRRSGADAVISSKTYAYTADQAEEAVEEARSALDRDVIDIFLLHEQESEHTLRGHAPALERLYTEKALGRIRAVGLSTHAVAGVRAAIAARLDIVHPILNLAGLGILDGGRQDMEVAVRAADNAGLGVYLMKALGGGNLYARAEEALAYALSSGHSVAIGMKRELELMANLHFLREGVFPESDWQELRGQRRRLMIEDHCEGCGRCLTACKAGALTLENGQAVCDARRCLLCGYCSTACAQFCIKMV